jgi:hypothetical protein
MSKRKITSQWRAAAFHEAGHAVVANFFGVRFISVGIDRVSKNGFLRATTRDPSYGQFGLELARSYEYQAETLVHLAGLASEGRHRGRFHWKNAENDLIDAAIRAAVLHDDGNVVEVDAFLRYAWVRTIEIVKRPLIWKCINAIAETIIERGSLREHEVREQLAPLTNTLGSAILAPIDRMSELGRRTLLNSHQDRDFLAELVRNSIAKTKFKGCFDV